MERDIDAFESAYGRLAGTRLSGVAPPQQVPGDLSHEGGPSKPAATPRSRLLPRLALMAPRRRTTAFER